MHISELLENPALTFALLCFVCTLLGIGYAMVQRMRIFWILREMTQFQTLPPISPDTLVMDPPQDYTGPVIWIVLPSKGPDTKHDEYLKTFNIRNATPTNWQTGFTQVQNDVSKVFITPDLGGGSILISRPTRDEAPERDPYTYLADSLCLIQEVLGGPLFYFEHRYGMHHGDHPEPAENDLLHDVASVWAKVADGKVQRWVTCRHNGSVEQVGRPTPLEEELILNWEKVDPHVVLHVAEMWGTHPRQLSNLKTKEGLGTLGNWFWPMRDMAGSTSSSAGDSLSDQGS